MAFKVAINAGHYINTPGKRCDKRYDKNQTREWWLNDRVVDRVIEGLKEYEGYEIIRCDDPTGKKDVSLKARTDAANKFGADIYISVHHNAGGGSGIVVYVYPGVGEKTLKLQKTVYDSLIATTGNKGNRASPLAKADFHEVRETKMPAVLCECGFMDHPVDTPLILTDKYATQLAKGFVNAIVKVGGLKKKPAPKPPEKPDGQPKADGLYRVQVGAFANKANADKLVAELKGKGYPAFVVES